MYDIYLLGSSQRNIRKVKSSQWDDGSSDESEKEQDTKKVKIEEPLEDEDEWETIEREREKDLLERDALNERIKKKDKERTRKIVEKSDKKVQYILLRSIHAM